MPFAAPGEFVRQEHDAERYGRFDRSRGNVDHTERRRCKTDRMGKGEGRHGGDQLANVPHQEDEAEHEEEMIRSREDVLDAEQAIGREHVRRPGVGTEQHGGAGRREPIRLDMAIGRLDTYAEHRSASLPDCGWRCGSRRVAAGSGARPA